MHNVTIKHYKSLRINQNKLNWIESMNLIEYTELNKLKYFLTIVTFREFGKSFKIIRVCYKNYIDMRLFARRDVVRVWPGRDQRPFLKFYRWREKKK